MDLGTEYTDKKVKKLEKELDRVYAEAYKDISKKLTDFTDRFVVKEEIYQRRVDEGKITQEQFDSWKRGQVFQGKQWKIKKEQILDSMYNTNNIAIKIINGNAHGIFAFNANYEAYQLEHGVGVSFGFGLYDQTTVARLIKDNPQTLPKWRIDKKKDYTWNKQKVNNAITQGIIQGERLDQITKRISDGLYAQNENLMKTFARTGMTAAQNAGRYERQIEAKQRGIEVVKQWMATLDNHTRDSHADIDGETQKVGDIWHPFKFSNGCRYPGDPLGPPHEVYNCRCTLVSDVEAYPSVYQRYDNIDGQPISNMTYREWEAAKKKEAEKALYAKYGDKETYDILKKYEGYSWEKFFDDCTFSEFTKVTHTATDFKMTTEEFFDNMSKHTPSTPAVSQPKPAPKPKVVKPPKITNPLDGIDEVPRTQDYIDDVTRISIENYGLRDKINNIFDEVADELNINPVDAEEGINIGLQQIIDNCDYTMRIRAKNLNKVLDDGYFKNQFETGSSGGAFAPSTRKQLEFEKFNVPKDGSISDADRPVYGMFCPKYDTNNDDIKDYYASGPGSWYGDGVTVVLKKEAVINNSTFTIGDSLDYQYKLAAMDPTDIQFAGYYSRVTTDELNQVCELGLGVAHDPNEVFMQLCNDGDQYLEYQLHGKETHSISNIEKVLISEDRSWIDDSFTELYQKLDEMGIPWEFINN